MTPVYSYRGHDMAYPMGDQHHTGPAVRALASAHHAHAQAVRAAAEVVAQAHSEAQEEAAERATGNVDPWVGGENGGSAGGR